MQTRTSLSDPLRIDTLPAGRAGGLIGITFCPGKCGPSQFGFAWRRDLDADLDVVAGWGAAAVLTLIEDHEFRQLRVEHLGAAVLARGMLWHHLPIKDVHPPDQRFEDGWASAGPALADLLHGGQRVLVHCMGGLGRAGTVSARLLIDMGEEPAQALARVRLARPGAVETSAQARYLLERAWTKAPR